MGGDKLAKNTANAPKFICPISLLKPKILGFRWKKRLHRASEVCECTHWLARENSKSCSATMHTSAALLSDVYSALSNWAIAQKSHECAKYLFHAEKQWTFAKMSYLHRYLLDEAITKLCGFKTTLPVDIEQISSNLKLFLCTISKLTVYKQSYSKPSKPP